ncbi:Cystathionine gamma-lyase [Papilio xuthus]|uniref:cystathionine gamma-lyase n=1 Tax=Papilio xuthus TaxID=66420 RepID=A0A0N1IAF9_PAPXU|nr:Cystathionine gamma-lyase [Papilio xuthus]
MKAPAPAPVTGYYGFDVLASKLLAKTLHHQMASDGFLNKISGFATLAIHAGQDPEKWNSAAVVPPIVTSTTFKQPAPAEHTGFEYGRSGNPTRNTLEECLAALDKGKHALTFASGLGATTTIASLLSCGDHIVSCDDVYGGTNRLFR